MTVLSLRLALMTIGAVLAILAPPMSARTPSADAETRDTWYVLKDGELVWGLTHVRTAPLSDGRTSYVTESRVLMTLFGTTQETVSHSHVIVDADLAPLSIESEVSQLSGKTRVEAQAADGELVVKVRSGDETTTHRVPVAGELPLIGDAALDTWLHRLPSDTTAGRVRVLDSASGDAGEVAFELVARSADGSTWRIDPGAVPGERTLRLDVEGTLIEQSGRFPPIRVVRHPDASELDLASRTLPARELLVFPVDRVLPPMRRIEAMTVELTWRDIDPEIMRLEDNRQSLESIETRDGTTTAVVRLKRAAENGPDRSLQPRGEATGDPSLAPYLATTAFVRPDDPEIARTASTIVGETSSARGAAKAICDWVASTVQTTMIAETLPGPEVLRRRIGKCTEFTTLYASLARSAGIPTRIALGQRLFSGNTGAQWGGHMWNEVWLGEWVPVDASHGEFGGSPSLLKFVDSDSVMGTQGVRWRLTESLAVAVRDVATQDVPHADGAVVEDGLHDGLWTSVERGIRFRVPSDGWTVERKDAPGVLLLRLRPPTELDPGDAAMIHVTAFDLPPGTPPRTVAQARLNSQRSALESPEILQDEAATVAGAVGHRTSFRGTPPGAPMVCVTELVWSKDGTGVLLNLISTQDLHESWRAVLERIAASFEHLDQ